MEKENEEKRKKKIWARIEIARETDNELSGSARFRAKIQWLNRVIKSRRRLTTTSRRLSFVQPNFLPFYSLLVINRQWLLIKFIALRWIGWFASFISFFFFFFDLSSEVFRISWLFLRLWNVAMYGIKIEKGRETRSELGLNHVTGILISVVFFFKYIFRYIMSILVILAFN